MPRIESFSSINHSVVPEILYPLGDEYASNQEIKEPSPAFSTSLAQSDFKMLAVVPDTNPLPYEPTEEIFPQSGVSETEDSLLAAIKNLLTDRIKVFVNDDNTLQQGEEELQKFIKLYSIYNYIKAHAILLNDKENLISELKEIAEECSDPDWDGYEGLSIEPSTLELAKSFIYTIPEELPLPEAAPESDGSISLDWIWSKDRVFSLSIGKTDELSYAWIDNEDRGYAIARFDGKNIPKRVIDSILGFLP